MSPLRGAIIRIKNDGRAMPRLTQAHCISHDDADADRGFLFIVPRGDDRAVLGGFAEPDEWDLDIGLHNYEPIRAIIGAAWSLCRRWRTPRSTRPSRSASACGRSAPGTSGWKREPGSRIVHNYGHGGSGVTFSWGVPRPPIASPSSWPRAVRHPERLSCDHAHDKSPRMR